DGARPTLFLLFLSSPLMCLQCFHVEPHLLGWTLDHLYCGRQPLSFLCRPPCASISGWTMVGCCSSPPPFPSFFFFLASCSLFICFIIGFIKIFSFHSFFYYYNLLL